jgi:tetratricopeptide (TPR) repeat protein
MEKFAHFCQKCRAANDPGETSCRKCGTRLMIVTFPSSLRHEAEMIPPSYYEDHLLERVTLLEFRLKQVTEQLAMAYEFISRQSDFFERDHLLIASFVEAVLEVDPHLSARLAEEMSDVYQKKKGELATADKKKKNLEEILSNHENPNAELFSHLVREGIRLLGEREEKQAFRTLERAALLSPANIPLHLFIAEKLFAADRYDEAEIYLEKVFELSPQNITALLLLGVIYADRYESEKARKMLSVLAGFPQTIACANYIWGMLAASEGNWKEATVAFKESVETLDVPEINYLIGCAYFQERNHLQALGYLEKSVTADKKFADAWFMICVIYGRLRQETKAETARQMAFQAKETGAKCLKFLGRKKVESLKDALPFLHFREDNRRLLTRFFRKLVFDSVD